MISTTTSQFEGVKHESDVRISRMRRDSVENSFLAIFLRESRKSLPRDVTLILTATYFGVKLQFSMLVRPLANQTVAVMP